MQWAVMDDNFIREEGVPERDWKCIRFGLLIHDEKGFKILEIEIHWSHPKKCEEKGQKY